MLKISEFSRLSRVPVKTLRYYAEIDLLPPAQVDPFTRYRYYSAEQLPRIRRILMLKGMGFQLVEIGRILNQRLTPSQVLQMAYLKRADLIAQLEAQQQQITQLDYWLEQLEQTKNMSDYTVSIKEVKPVTVSYVRGIVPTQPELGTYLSKMFDSAMSHAAAHEAVDGITIAEYYDEEWTGTDIDVAAAVILSKPVEPAEGVEVRELRSGTVAFARHVGEFKFLSQAYDAVLQWVAANGYQVNGAGREVYVECQPDMDPSEYVTEVQFFVTKA